MLYLMPAALILAITLAATAGASIVSAVTGFGFALLSAPVQLLLLPGPAAVGVLTGLSLISNLAVVHSQRLRPRLRDVALLAVPAAALTPFAVLLVADLGRRGGLLAAGLVLLVASAAVAAPGRVRWPAGPLGVAVTGVLSAFGSAVGAISGPPAVALANRFGWSPARRVAALQSAFAVINIVTLISVGPRAVAWWWLWLASVPAALLGARLGAAAIRRWPVRWLGAGTTALCIAGSVITLGRALL